MEWNVPFIFGMHICSMVQEVLHHWYAVIPCSKVQWCWMTAFQISAIHILRAAKLLWRQKKPKSSTELKLTNKKLHKTKQQQQNMKQTQKKKTKLPPPKTPTQNLIHILYKFFEVLGNFFPLMQSLKNSSSKFIAESTSLTNKT